MPPAAPRPASMQIAGVVGVLEGLGLLGYALTIAAIERSQPTAGIRGSDLAPGVLVGLYVAFALLILTVTRALTRGSRRAWTPYLLAQAFALVVAQALFAYQSTWAIGGVVVGLAAVGSVCASMPSTRACLG